MSVSLACDYVMLCKETLLHPVAETNAMPHNHILNSERLLNTPSH